MHAIDCVRVSLARIGDGRWRRTWGEVWEISLEGRWGGDGGAGAGKGGGLGGMLNGVNIMEESFLKEGGGAGFTSY